MKDFKTYLVAAAALLIIYLVAQYNEPKAVDWTETFDKNEKSPFGTLILYQRLPDIFPNAEIKPLREPVNSVIEDFNLKNSSYIIICPSLNFTDYDYNLLVKYIAKGNDVFIAADDFGDVFQQKLNINTFSESERNSQTYLNFQSKSAGDSTYLVDHRSSNGYFRSFDTTKTNILGQNGYNHPTFLRMQLGKGNLYLSANPRMFSNYSLLQDQGMAYAETALSHLRVQQGLVWDEFYSKGRENKESSMRVFLSHSPLRWAFYLVTFSLLLFVLYQSKRRQRIIPEIPPVANTTVEFANIVGQVYYEQRDNGDIARKKAAYFLEHVRSRYQLQTRQLDTQLAQTLADKSGVSLKLINEIFEQIATVQEGYQISDPNLISFNHHIEQFYNQSR